MKLKTFMKKYFGNLDNIMMERKGYNNKIYKLLARNIIKNKQ